MEKSLVYQKAYAFSLEIVKVYRSLVEKKEYDLNFYAAVEHPSEQTCKRGYFQSRLFSEGFNQESLETKYWLNLLHDNYITVHCSHEKTATHFHIHFDGIGFWCADTRFS